MDWYTFNKIKFQAESVEQQNSWCGLCGCEGGCNLCDPVKELESDRWQAIIFKDLKEEIKILVKIYGETRKYVEERAKLIRDELDNTLGIILRSPEIKRPQYFILYEN